MARIVLGLGTSHTPMLLADAADLPRYAENDRRVKLLDHSGAPVSFDVLLAAALNERAASVTPERLAARHAAGRRALDAMADDLAAAALDALVIIGDDQQEMLRGETMPPLLVYAGATIRSQRPPHPPGRPEWVLRASDRYYPASGAIDYPVAQALARHVVSCLRQQAWTVETTEPEAPPACMGHAFAFVYAQLMLGRTIPVVPVLLNALYPPTQPDPRRCLQIGSALAQAIASFPADARVGIVASGGLSHFVVDEVLDQAVIRALVDQDETALAALPVHKLNSGSAEIRNWICAAGALRALRVNRIDYIAGYRTAAGTGTGLCFAVWR
ncbi:MAG TPA: hypothetical protein VHO91_14930 [Rhodopila sp.]|nr:hypothetical protein [Rhodopila sp.]